MTSSDQEETQSNGKYVIAQSQVDGNFNLKNLNPSPNLLQLPKAPQAVKITVDQPITLEQALQLAIANNKIPDSNVFYVGGRNPRQEEET